MKDIKKLGALLTLLVGVFLLSAGNASAQEPGVAWKSSYEEAAKQAKAEHKPLLMVFSGSDWCKPCIMLHKEVWDSEAFQQYAKDNLVLLELDFPRLKKNQLSAKLTKQNEKLASQYNPDGMFPLVVLTDAEGNVIAKTGYQAGGAEKYVSHLKSLLK